MKFSPEAGGIVGRPVSPKMRQSHAPESAFTFVRKRTATAICFSQRLKKALLYFEP
jgi:hypothetical protein